MNVVHEYGVVIIYFIKFPRDRLIGLGVSVSNHEVEGSIPGTSKF